MNRTVRCSAALSAIALSLLIAGCQRSGAAGAESLSLDKPATGEITTNSPLNYGDGTRTALFSFKLAAGEAVAIEAGASFCGRLTLYAQDAGGRNVLQGGDSGSECVEKNGRLVQVRSSVSPDGGRYVLAFSGREAGDFGPYRVSLSSLALDADRDLVVGDEVTALLVEEKTWLLKVTEAGRYQFDLRSSEFDPTLTLAGQGVSRESDDDGEGTDARLIGYLSPGDYRLTVGRVGSAGGLYRLSVSAKDDGLAPGVEVQNGGELTVGSDLVGMLQGEPARYQLTLAERSRVTLSMTSDDFDTRLEISGEGVRMSDDDSGEGTHSRLVTVLDAGSYTITAFDLGDGNAGLFTLSAESSPASTSVERLVPGMPASDSLESGEQRRYRLSVPTSASYVFTMRSSSIDSVLNVVRNGEVIGTDDDGGGDTDARLTLDLQPGEYEVVASTFGGDSGSFRIEASVR
ncbi:hypothetical protein [Arenimonas alkanexedens]